MKSSRVLCITSVFLFLLSPAIVQAGGPEGGGGFIENKDQIVDQNGNPNPDVLYLYNSPGLNIQLRKAGFSYDTYTVERELLSDGDEKTMEGFPSAKYNQPEYRANYKFHRIDVELIGANPDAEIITGEASSDYTNYYNVIARPEGVLFVRTYQWVLYKNIYPNTDLEFIIDAQSGAAKYNFILHPGADIKMIKMKYVGAPVVLDADNMGTLTIPTANGSLREQIPASHCFYEGKKQKIEVVYSCYQDNIYGFSLPAGFSLHPGTTLVIDPVPDLTWGTYYGGSFGSAGSSVTTGNDGSVYLAGKTSSSDFISTSGSHQDSLYYGPDALLAKFNTNGQRIWATYYGGEGDDRATSVKYSTYNSVYITGFTSSALNIATPGAFMESPFGGQTNTDGFVVKFSSEGVRQWGTYYGGESVDLIFGATSDDNDNIYFIGYTNSTAGIATPGSYADTFIGDYDAFFVKFDSSGNRLWGTYYGGPMQEVGEDICIYRNEELYIGGITSSSSGIATPGTYQQDCQGCVPSYSDAFLARFTTSGQRIWGTYYGGPKGDYCLAIGSDNNANVYITGVTNSDSLIATAGAHQTVIGSLSNDDAFLAKFDSTGMILWSTYYGGTANDEGIGIEVNSGGDVFLAGSSGSSTNISTPGAYQTVCGGCSGGLDDAFLVKFNSSGTRQWGTYYGGNIDESCYDLALDIYGSAYITGTTASPTGISTPGAHQENLLWWGCAFLAKFADGIIAVEERPEMEETINIYPSPASANVRVEWSPDLEISELFLFNVMGMRVFSAFPEQNYNYHTFDCSGLSPGVYLVIIQTNEKVFTKKLVIQ